MTARRTTAALLAAVLSLLGLLAVVVRAPAAAAADVGPAPSASCNYDDCRHWVNAPSVALDGARLAIQSPPGPFHGTRSQVAIIAASVFAAEEAGAGGNIVYRGLAEGENPEAGLNARAPGADVSPVSHVAGKGASPWISTTKSLDIATNKYGKFGVVGIDLSKVGSEVVDVSGGFPGVPGMLSNWARLDQEVLIRDFIPSEAIFFP